MRYSKWIGLLAAVTVLIICYQPWIYVPFVQLEIGGMYASGKQNFGRPGLVNMIMTGASVMMFLLPFIWAKRTNIFLCAFNIAWAFRNYILLTKCYAGDCPVIKPGLYILLLASLLLLAMSFVPDIKITEEKK
jgi:hypothetical protein